MGKRLKLHEFNAGNDIRYRGPFSYMGFQVLGWLCIVCTIVVLELRIGAKVSSTIASRTQSLSGLLAYIGTMSLPFLLIANYARILNNSEGFRKQMIRNGGAALAIFLVGFIFINRYMVSLFGLFVTDPENIAPILAEGFRVLQPNGFVAFNIFIDLFLCTLFMFFLTAWPKRVFTGKKVLLFRLFTILPVAYEVFSFVLKGRSAAGEITLPLWSFPLLTVKPPVTFLVFMVLAVYIKTRERRFRRHGRTHTDYQAFLKTKRNSLHFSVFLSVTMVIAAIVDFFILSFLTITSIPSEEALNDTVQLAQAMRVGEAMGFGDSIPLLFVAPFVLLFSYTKLPKKKQFGILIPLIAIALVLITVFEGIYQGMGIYAMKIEKHTVQELIESFGNFVSSV